MSNKAECAVGGFLPYEGLLLIARKDRNMRLWWNESSWTSYLVRKLTKYKMLYIHQQNVFISFGNLWKLPSRPCWSSFFAFWLALFFWPGKPTRFTKWNSQFDGKGMRTHACKPSKKHCHWSCNWGPWFGRKHSNMPRYRQHHWKKLGESHRFYWISGKNLTSTNCCFPVFSLWKINSGHPSMIPRKKRILKCLQSFLDWIRYTVTVTVGITCCLKQHVFGICGRWENVAISWDSVGT